MSHVNTKFIGLLFCQSDCIITLMPGVELMNLKRNFLHAAKLLCAELSKYSFGGPCMPAMALMAYILACMHILRFVVLLLHPLSYCHQESR